MEIYNSDCFDKFKDIDKKISLILVDLPYGQTDCKWDKKIDLDRMWIELKKICKKDCVYVFFTTTKFGNEIINSNPKMFKYDLVWHKSTKCGFMNAAYMPLRSHEMLYIFKKCKGCYNPQKIKGKPYTTPGHKHGKDVYNKTRSVKIVNNGDRHPTSILKYNSVHKSIHRTQKPVDLCEWIINSYSNKGDVVLDFCMGSGTTGIACKNTDRYFIGIEIDEDIYKLAKERLN